MADVVARVPFSNPGAQSGTDTVAGSKPAGRFERFARIGHRIAVILTLMLLIGAGGLFALRTMYSGKVLPSVYVADIPVGGMTQSDALALVDNRANTLLNSTVVFDYDGRQWTTTLSALGVKADSQGSVDLAFSLGRENDARDRVGSAIQLTRDEQVVPLRFAINPGAIDAWVETVTSDINLEPVNAQIQVQEGKVTVTDDVDGIVVDKAEVRAIVERSIDSLSPYRGPLPIRNEAATIHSSDIENDVQRLKNALAEPIKVTYKKKKWTLQPTDLGQFVVIAERADKSGYDVSIDDSELGQWIHGLIGERINREPVNAEIRWNSDKERIVAITESSIGVRLQAAPTAHNIVQSFFGDHHATEVTVKGIRPEIDANHLEDLNIKTRMAVGTSAFYGSNEPRAINIRVGTEHLNGTVIAPGAQFSFNASVGDITEEAGYVEAPVVDGERIGKDVGGGICQVSTTIFRAAFYAGLPIVDWWPHLYRLPFYEFDGWSPGLDASILQSGPRESWGDFTFNNTSGGYLLIEAYVDGETDVVVIYGPKTGWNVEVSEPSIGEPILGDDMPDVEVVDPELDPGTITQTELRQDGLQVSYTRVVTDKDGNVISDRIFYSRFAARGDVWTVSSDMKGESPATLNPHKVGSDNSDSDESI